jgi:hypothetical protein
LNKVSLFTKELDEFSYQQPMQHIVHILESSIHQCPCPLKWANGRHTTDNNKVTAHCVRLKVKRVREKGHQHTVIPTPFLHPPCFDIQTVEEEEQGEY